MPPQDRDHAVEQWLRRAPIAGARADACLDAETLAAWTEGTLDASMRSMAEAHAATCGRCQEMLAVMLRTTPVATSAAGSPMRKWLMMLGPALAAATAVALWIAVDRRPAPAPVDTLAKQEAHQERAVARPAEPAAPVREQDAKTRGDSSERAVKERPEARLGAGSEAAADKADRREPSSPAAAKPSDEERRYATADTPASFATMSAPAPAPPPPPAAARQKAAAAAEEARKANQAEVVSVTAASPPTQTQAARVAAETKAEAGRGGSVQGFAGGRLDAVAGLTFDVTVTDRTAQWRVVEGRLVQRSLDQGRSWSTQYAIDAGPGRINAGICPAAAVCWLAGRSGLVLRTTDGRNWQRLAFSQDVELTSVSSADARTATVTAADGRRFVTTDGGRTWIQQ